MNLVPKGCSEMCVTNYQYALRNIPEELRSHLVRGGSLKSLLVKLIGLSVQSTILPFQINDFNTKKAAFCGQAVFMC